MCETCLIYLHFFIVNRPKSVYLSNDRCARWPRNIFKQKHFLKYQFFIKPKKEKKSQVHKQRKKYLKQTNAPMAPSNITN